MRAHLVCNVVGTVLTATAFVAIYVNKNRLGKDHFTSWHGLFGALCVLFIAANASTVGGVCRCRSAYLSYPGCFTQGIVRTALRLSSTKYPLLWKSALHRAGGGAAFVLLGLTFYFGFGTAWVARIGVGPVATWGGAAIWLSLIGMGLLAMV